MTNTNYAEVDEQLGPDIWKKTEVKWEEILGLSMMIASKRYIEQLCAVQDHYRETGEKPTGWHQQYEYILDVNGDIRLSHDRMSRGEGFAIESFALTVKSGEGRREAPALAPLQQQPFTLPQPQQEEKKKGFWNRVFGR